MKLLTIILITVSLNVSFIYGFSSYSKRESDLFQWQVVIKNIENKPQIDSRTIFENHPKFLFKNDKYIFLSVKEQVYCLNPTNLEKIRVIYWPDPTPTDCKNEASIACENRVQVSIQLSQNRFQFCGFKTRKPKCEEYFINNDKIEEKSKSVDIDINKLVSSTKLPSMQPLVSDNQLYYANDYDSNIWTYNLTKNSVYVQTYQPINKPEFLNSFVFKEKAYFFYREFDTDKNVWVSYVSDFCKDEEGQKYKNPEESYLTTFKKAFIKCLYNDTDGNIKTYTHLEYITKPIRSKTLSKQDESDRYLLFGSFSSAEDDFNTSVLCDFDMDQVIEQINKNFYEKQYLGSLVYSSDDCSTKMSFQDFSSKVTNSRYRLKHPITSLAIYRSNNIIIKSIDVDTSNNDSDIIYVGYSNGRLSKLTSYQQTSTKQVKTIILQDYHIFNNSAVTKLIAVNNKLIVFNNAKVNILNSSNCEQYATCKACVESQDPDCSWVAPESKCKYKGNGIKSIFDGYSHECKIEDAKNEKTRIKKYIFSGFAGLICSNILGIFIMFLFICTCTKSSPQEASPAENIPLRSISNLT